MWENGGSGAGEMGWDLVWLMLELVRDLLALGVELFALGGDDAS